MSEIVEGAVSVLEAAKGVLLERGWVKNASVTERGVCLSYAITLGAKEAQATEYGCATARNAIYDVVAKRTGHIGIAHFNDAGSRKFEEVIDVIDESIIHIKETYQ